MNKLTTSYYHILIVDDDEGDVFLTKELLSDIPGQEYEVDWAVSYEEGRRMIGQKNHDLYLIDYRLGALTGIDLLNYCIEIDLKAPVIILTGLEDKNIDWEAMNAGATDYIVKDEINTQNLERTIRYAVTHYRDMLKIADNERFATIGKVARFFAHEIRNPLTNIDISISELKAELEGQPEEIQRYIGFVEKNSQRINLLLSEIINSTKSEEITLAANDLNIAVKEALGLADDRIKLNGITVEIDLNEKGCMVLMDIEKLKIAFLNIIINAIEAMTPNQGVLKIRTEKEKERYVVIIQDNGNGISKENLEKIFEPFYTNKAKGTGLGLSSTRHVIQNHKGTIDVKSEPAKGTAFKVSFLPGQ